MTSGRHHNPLDQLLSRIGTTTFRKRWLGRVLWCVLALWLPVTPGRSDEAESRFTQEIAPLLEQHCAKCHRKQKLSGKLNLEGAEGLARGGDSGPAIVPGKLDESLLWEMVSSDVMPPDPEQPLGETEKTQLKAWIEAGAPGLPRGSDGGAAGHWAFRTPRRPAVPAVTPGAHVRNEIDAFVHARLERKGLTFSAEADKAPLLRRLAIDLTGLPPSPAEIASFLSDTDDGAYERMVEQYLNSPQYGERWGKYWLDVAGYADSNGYFNADSDRPLAYRYRDYVIRAHQTDKPFDRFVWEQLAGDELVRYSPGGDITPEMVEPLVATHFLRNSQDGTGESDGNDDELLADRFAVLEGTVQIVGASLLGLTMQCAKCHDHKFEPVSQREYYGLQAIFWPAYCPDQWRKPKERVVEVGTRAEREAHAAAVAEVQREVRGLKESIEGSAAPLRELLVRERIAAADAAEREALRAAWEAKPDERTDEQKALLEKHKELVQPNEDAVAERFAEFQAFREQLRARIDQAEKKRPAPLKAISILWEPSAEPSVHHVRVRGDYHSMGESVEPIVPAALCLDEGPLQIDAAGASPHRSGRRSALARWLTDPRNPLLARMQVNRIWQQHFGSGLVASPENFGLTGSEPSHPELLDWLACAFVDSGWSQKQMHRLMVNSATYRQASAETEAGRAVDPDNRLYWRFALRRLDAEAVRDGMLAASGELDLAEGGPYVPTQRGGDGAVVVDEKTTGAHRRSIYMQQRRTQVMSLLDVFDAPSLVTNCTRRATSTIPLQALALLNSEFISARAEALAARIEREAGARSEDRVAQAFLLVLGRAPSEGERLAAGEFLARQPGAYPEQQDAEARVWRDFCQSLLASNAYLYVE
jgi:hypothetical protein